MADAVRWALGLMSGTSLDGIDAALVRTDGRRIAALGPWRTEPYTPELREQIRAVLGGQGSRQDEVAVAERALTDAHAEAVRLLLTDARMPDGEVALIGFHGHTILHRPEQRRTWQIGDGARLAALTGIDVVADFRSADVAAGGQGAPFVPLYHAALAAALPKPLAVLNLGGVANVTWIGSDRDSEPNLIAFDTGPGNALIDDWVRLQVGEPCDRDGRLAAAGSVDHAALDALMDNAWFGRPPPKSLDRDDFSAAPVRGLSAADGAATLTAFTARAVQAAIRYLPAPPARWLVTGGGRHNPALMAALGQALAVAVEPVEAVGWRGDALEAEAFAYLAVRSRAGLYLSLPSTTGVPRPLTGGRFFPAGPVSRKAG